jgi:methylglutaconyl-CoA hydratase
MPADPPVLCEIDARGVASVTLNRPRVNNAYNGALIDALIETFARLDRDPALRVVVLRGAGRHRAAAGKVRADARRRPRDSRGLKKKAD